MTWAGPGFDERRFLFGFNDGYIGESGIDSPWPNSGGYKAVNEPEPINSVAHAIQGDALYLAASTRAEITVHRLADDGSRPTPLWLDFGSHGICSTVQNGFIAPLGTGGVITIIPGPDGSGK